jgi:hypothetical protein
MSIPALPARPLPSQASRLGKALGGTLIAIVIAAIVRVGVRGGFSSESWSEHEVVGGLVMTTPRSFSEMAQEPGKIQMPGMKQVSMEGRSTYAEAVVIDVPKGASFELDDAMKGLMDMVTSRPGNSIANQRVSHSPMLGLETERCDFDITRDGTTKPITALVMSSGTKVWGVIAGGDKPDLDRMITSLHFAPGAAPNVAK